jgi:S1-C subfamily serine protease
MNAKTSLSLVASSLILLPVAVAAQQAPTLSLTQFERFINNEISEPGLLTRIGEMCPDFMAADPAVSQRLRALNVSERVLQALSDRRMRCAPPIPVPATDTMATLVLRMATPSQGGGTRFPNRERMLVIGARGDTLSRLTTDTLGWGSALRLAVGQYTINAQHVDSAARLRYEWRVPFPALAGRVDTLLLASHNVAERVTLEPERRVDSVFSVRQLVNRSRGSLLAVQGREQHGSAIVLDTTGLDPRLLFLATSYRLVRDASDIRVTVNDTLRLKAHFLTGDSTTDLALLSIARPRCTGCQPVRLSDSTASAQDEIVVIGAPTYREGRNVQQALVQDVGANRIVINQMLDSTANGGGVFDDHGRLVGLWTTQAGGRRDFSVAVPARQIAAARDAAVKRRAAPPYDQLLPITPRRAFPEAAVKSAVTTNDPNLKPFVFTTGEFKVMIMTPQIAAWRQKRAQAELAEKKPSFKPTDPDMIDPIEVWTGWKDYLASRKALVLVQVAPKDAGFPSYDVNETITRARADVWEVALKRDTATVDPVDRALVPAMVRHVAAKARNVAPARQAILLYRISDFRLNDDGSHPFMQFAITDSKNPGAHFPLIIPPQTIDALNTAFRVWLNSADQAATR